MTETLDAQSIAEALANAQLVTVSAGSISEMKALRDQCLANGIPATLGCPSGGGCGPRTHLLVTPDMVPNVAALFADAWNAQLAKEGLPAIAPRAMAPEFSVLEPCPACGMQAPLVAGACSDCGLQLE